MSDLISRQTAIDALDQIFDRCEEIEAHLPEGDPDRTGYKMYPDYMTVWKYLHQLPPAQPERKKGKWIPQDHNKTNGIASTLVYYYPKCSVCGHCDNYTNFCSNCGADMRGEHNV